MKRMKKRVSTYDSYSLLSLPPFVLLDVSWARKLIGCFLQAKVESYSYVCAEPKTKTIKESKWDWELLNDVKAVWLRNPKDVTPEEYDKFYHSLAKVNDLSRALKLHALCWKLFFTSLLKGATCDTTGVAGRDFFVMS
jgi:hypothetical protein